MFFHLKTKYFEVVRSVHVSFVDDNHKCHFNPSSTTTSYIVLDAAVERWLFPLLSCRPIIQIYGDLNKIFKTTAISRFTDQSVYFTFFKNSKVIYIYI